MPHISTAGFGPRLLILLAFTAASQPAAALEVFLTERWEDAAAAFAELTSRFPDDRASMFYLDICRRYASGGAPESEPTRLAMTEK